MMLKESRSKRFGYAIIVLFVLNFILGGFGTICPPESVSQTISWQLALTTMIAACVLMGAYIAERGWSFASGGFYLLGVAHGSFFASIAIDSYQPHTLARGVIVMVPAFIALGMSRYFPTWLKVVSISICIPFLILYYQILTDSVYQVMYSISFFYLSFVALCWSYNLWREMRMEENVG